MGSTSSESDNGTYTVTNNRKEVVKTGIILLLFPFLLDPPQNTERTVSVTRKGSPNVTFPYEKS